jgi:hypothetical protein
MEGVTACVQEFDYGLSARPNLQVPVQGGVQLVHKGHLGRAEQWLSLVLDLWDAKAKLNSRGELYALLPAPTVFFVLEPLGRLTDANAGRAQASTGSPAISTYTRMPWWAWGETARRLWRKRASRGRHTWQSTRKGTARSTSCSSLVRARALSPLKSHSSCH